MWCEPGNPIPDSSELPVQGFSVCVNHTHSDTDTHTSCVHLKPTKHRVMKLSTQHFNCYFGSRSSTGRKDIQLIELSEPQTQMSDGEFQYAVKSASTF